MFHSLFGYTLPSLLTMISVRLRNNQGKGQNTKHFSTIQLIRVFCPHRLSHQQNYVNQVSCIVTNDEVSNGIKPSAYIPIPHYPKCWVVPWSEEISFPPAMNSLEGLM